ncbi:MAG TPA: L-2-hydroxyglutarate oxidase, partial [Terriglobales bacterium]|nr:L-2-hydroxyglutarate oxidase [Terriglobales bacterium]
RLCVEGAAQMSVFCQEHGIPYRICGKVIVATSAEEIPRLHALLERGASNGIKGVKLLDRAEVREREPHCGGVAWLLVPGTGITDYRKVCQKYAELVAAHGGSIRTSTEVQGMARRGQEVAIETNRGSFATRYVINCAGLYSDRVSRMSGQKPAVSIVPFRGEYYDLIPPREHLVQGLIYPVPDVRFPFLGVHFTRRIGGGVDAGPNAVLAFKREGYRKTDFNLREFAQTLTFPGFWRMAAKYWRAGAAEFYRSFSKSAFVHALQKLIPEVTNSDLAVGGSGVRAQAVLRDGSLVDDFQFACNGNLMQVWNVPSPAATASLPIGAEIVGLARQAFRLE